MPKEVLKLEVLKKGTSFLRVTGDRMTQELSLVRDETIYNALSIAVADKENVYIYLKKVETFFLWFLSNR